MSYASGTTHYNLPQTVGTDKRDWTDTNQAFSDVDTALYGAVQSAETATSGITTLNAAVETINGKLATDEGNISTLSGKVSTLESTVAGHTTAISDVRQDLQDNIESHTEASATSTHAYNVGDTFYYNDVLYRATASISIGGTIVPSTNCTAITVMSDVNELKSFASEHEWVKVAESSGDGTKTYAQVLNAITSAWDFDADYEYQLVYDENQLNYGIMHQVAGSGASATFSRSFVASNATSIVNYTVWIGTTSAYVTGASTTSGNSVVDHSSEVCGNTVTYTLYKRKR